MPHKFNAARRHKFEKKRYRVTNWASYSESLRRRGDLTVWFDADALDLWVAPRRLARGGQPKYSDMAITVCLTLGVVFKQPLRQTQGLMRSLTKLMELDIPVPDFSTLSRRGRGLRLPAKPRTRRDQPVHLVVDSTGLKIFGEGEWLQNKHNTRAKRKSWRKLHLGLDLVTGEIICADLTLDDVGDPTALPGLLDQIDGPVSRFLADGAYDGAPNSNLLKERFGDAVEIIIPPPKNAVPSPQSTYEPTQRDRHISEIHAQGRLAWQSSSGYNQRSRVETQIGRWKGVIGPKLKARSFENQKTEDRSQDRRHRSQRNDRPWPPRIRGGHVTMFKGKGAFRPLRDPCNNALTIRDHAFNTNLGIAASQDDASLQAIIPWGPKEAV